MYFFKFKFIIIQKFFYKWYKKANCLTIEINPSAINVAKQFFKIPKSSKRFKIIQDDGIDYIKNSEDEYDLILSDAFEEYGLPEVFCEIPYPVLIPLMVLLLCF